MFNCRTLIFSFTPIDIVFQRDLWWWTRRQIWSFIQFLSIFQSFNFYNTMGWECSLKNNCVRSCLIERLSFFDSKINIDPKYRILMSLPCSVHVSCKTWCREVNILWIFVTIISWINKQKEHCLSFAQILTSRYQSIADNRMKIECASNMINVREYSSSNQHIVLQRWITEIASRMSLKSTEVENCSRIIRVILISFFSNLLLQPNKLSNNQCCTCE